MVVAAKLFNLIPVAYAMEKPSPTVIYPWHEWKNNIEIVLAQLSETSPASVVEARRAELIRHMLSDNLCGIALSGVGRGFVDGFEAISAFKAGDLELMWSILENQPRTPPVVYWEGEIPKSSTEEVLFNTDDRSEVGSVASLSSLDSG